MVIYCLGNRDLGTPTQVKISRFRHEISDVSLPGNIDGVSSPPLPGNALLDESDRTHESNKIKAFARRTRYAG